MRSRPCAMRASTSRVVPSAAERRVTLWTAPDEREVPPAGFEPAISALKGLRPRPLDDEGSWAVLKLMYRSGEPEHGFDHGFGVLQIVEQHVWLMHPELRAGKIAGGDRHDPRAASAGAGDIARRVADHDDLGRADLLSEV